MKKSDCTNNPLKIEIFLNDTCVQTETNSHKKYVSENSTNIIQEYICDNDASCTTCIFNQAQKSDCDLKVGLFINILDHIEKSMNYLNDDKALYLDYYDDNVCFGNKGLRVYHPKGTPCVNLTSTTSKNEFCDDNGKMYYVEYEDDVCGTEKSRFLLNPDTEVPYCDSETVGNGVVISKYHYCVSFSYILNFSNFIFFFIIFVQLF